MALKSQQMFDNVVRPLNMALTHFRASTCDSLNKEKGKPIGGVTMGGRSLAIRPLSDTCLDLDELFGVVDISSALAENRESADLVVSLPGLVLHLQFFRYGASLYCMLCLVGKIKSGSEATFNN